SPRKPSADSITFKSFHPSPLRRRQTGPARNAGVGKFKSDRVRRRLARRHRQQRDQAEQFQKAEASQRLIKISTGDGIALVFYTDLEAPVRCAMELSRALKDRPRLRLR